MASTHKHIRSSTANKRPTTSIADGQVAINTNSASPGLFFKDSTGATIIKVGPVHVGTTAPNASPAVGGSTGNSTGEIWLDTSLTPNGVKIWNGSSWTNATPIGSTTVQGLLELATNAETQAGTDADRAVTPAGLQSKVSDSISTVSSSGIASSTAVKTAYDLANAALPAAGGTITGPVIIGSGGSLSFEGATDDTFETTLGAVDPTANNTILLPNVSGTVITTGDSGTVTSTMILNGTIVNGDINASAAIADTKLGTISTANKVSLSALNIDGGTDIGDALADADLFVVDDGGAGTNRKAAATRITDYAFGKVSGDITIGSTGTAAIGTGVIVNADVSASAEIAVSKLANGTARQLIQTDTTGSGVEWTSNIDIPGTLDVTGAAVFDSSVSVTGALTKSGSNVVTVGDTGTVTSTMIADGTIVNADVNASAAIAHSKLASITAGSVLLGNASNVPTATAVTGDVTITSSGVTAIGASKVTNAMLAGSIDDTKLNQITTASKVSGTALTGTIPSTVLGNSTAYVGTTAVALNRASANQGLTGISSIALPGATSGTITMTPAATAGTTAITIPATAGTLVTTGDSGSVTSTMIADGTIVNGDINASAAIAHTKLANITAGSILMGNASNVPTATAVTGDVTISNTGVTAIGSSKVTSAMIVDGTIVNGDINASAAIAVSKLGAGTSGQFLKTNATPATEWSALSLQDIPTAWAKDSAVVATTAALTVTFASNVLTNAGTLAALVIDGYTCALNDRILVKDQASALQNGIYYVSNVGSASVAWTLTRAADANTNAELAGAVIAIDRGTSGGSIWQTTFKSNNTLNSAAVNWYSIPINDGTIVTASTMSAALTDSTSLTFGAGADMSIRHDGTNNYISMTNGDLIVRDGTTNRFYLERTSGYFGIGTNPGRELDVLNTSTNGEATRISNNNGSYAGTMVNFVTTRAGTSSFNFFYCRSNADTDGEFAIQGNGTVFADGSYNATGADYAEYFEWEDQNVNDEDRRGMSVVLSGNKIRKALDGEEPIGIVSSNPAVVGDNAWDHWNNKYLRDEFGSYIWEFYEVEDEYGEIVIQERRKLNPNYDPTQEYVPRDKRPEWACIGLVGKLRMRKGQPVGSRWIKMRDISSSVEEWLLR